VTAGKPEMEENFQEIEVEGIPFYVRNEMAGNAYQVDWVGIWKIGTFVVKELQ